MSWGAVIGAGVSLVGSASASSRARRGNNQAQNIARENAARTNALIPTNGFSINTNSGGALAGPSFTFGGTTGSNGILLGGQNRFGSSIGQGTQGQTSSAGTFRDPITGVVFDGITGQQVTGETVQVGENQSFLNLEVPTFSANTGAVTASSGRLQGLNNELSALGDQFQGIADEFGVVGVESSNRLLDIASQAGGLLPRIAVGASEMREARLNQIDDAEAAAVSDLKESLSRRRIAGSSFGNDDISRAKAEFGRQRAEAEAQTSLEEISATSQILGFQTQVIQASANHLLEALGGELSAAGGELQTLIEQGNNERQISQNGQFTAAIGLQVQQAQFNAEATALSLAFQGQQLAQDYIIKLTAIANGASDAIINTIGNQTSLDSSIANGFLGATGGFLSDINLTSTGGGSDDDDLILGNSTGSPDQDIFAGIT